MFDYKFTHKFRIIDVDVIDSRTPEFAKYASSTCQAQMRQSHFVSSWTFLIAIKLNHITGIRRRRHVWSKQDAGVHVRSLITMSWQSVMKLWKNSVLCRLPWTKGNSKVCLLHIQLSEKLLVWRLGTLSSGHIWIRKFDKLLFPLLRIVLATLTASLSWSHFVASWTSTKVQ